MFCDICIKLQKSNSFTTGCAILKRDNVTKHAKCKGKLFHIIFFDCGVGGWVGEIVKQFGSRSDKIFSLV